MSAGHRGRSGDMRRRHITDANRDKRPKNEATG